LPIASTAGDDDKYVVDDAAKMARRGQVSSPRQSTREAAAQMSQKTGRIYVGVGGWNYAPWRASFYPAGLPHKRELEYASHNLTSIEINATYCTGRRELLKWRDGRPGFRFQRQSASLRSDARTPKEPGGD
jgi:hypothetical protein